jgi:hypothetical protein
MSLAYRVLLESLSHQSADWEDLEVRRGR